ncbi:MAG: hypothetical protein FWE25_02855 [Lachnospiraceae bacterium]|nr:hypothetical protein [Lachnospiraceae bacterium]
MNLEKRRNKKRRSARLYGLLVATLLVCLNVVPHVSLAGYDYEAAYASVEYYDNGVEYQADDVYVPAENYVPELAGDAPATYDVPANLDDVNYDSLADLYGEDESSYDVETCDYAAADDDDDDFDFDFDFDFDDEDDGYHTVAFMIGSIDGFTQLGMLETNSAEFPLTEVAVYRVADGDSLAYVPTVIPTFETLNHIGWAIVCMATDALLDEVGVGGVPLGPITGSLNIIAIMEGMVPNPATHTVIFLSDPAYADFGDLTVEVEGYVQLSYDVTHGQNLPVVPSVRVVAENMVHTGWIVGAMVEGELQEIGRYGVALALGPIVRSLVIVPIIEEVVTPPPPPQPQPQPEPPVGTPEGETGAGTGTDGEAGDGEAAADSDDDDDDEEDNERTRTMPQTGGMFGDDMTLSFMLALLSISIVLISLFSDKKNTAKSRRRK